MPLPPVAAASRGRPCWRHPAARPRHRSRGSLPISRRQATSCFAVNFRTLDPITQKRWDKITQKSDFPVIFNEVRLIFLEQRFLNKPTPLEIPIFISMSLDDTIRFCLTGGRPAHVFQLYDLVRPQTCAGLQKIRIGNRQGDGGYVMINDFNGIAAALSLGIGDDISWDVEMSEHGVEIYQFDHTVEPPAEVATNPRLHFYQCGIAGHAAPERHLKTIGEILLDEMADKSGDLILKMDIEGYEWDAFALMPDAVLGRFRQICIEIHNPLGRPSQRAQRTRNLSVLQKFHRMFAPVHLNANNAGPVRHFYGLAVPKLLEITYIRRDAQVFSESLESYPGEFDAPNTPANPEIKIGQIVRQRAHQ